MGIYFSIYWSIYIYTARVEALPRSCRGTGTPTLIHLHPSHAQDPLSVPGAIRSTVVVVDEEELLEVLLELLEVVLDEDTVEEVLATRCAGCPAERRWAARRWAARSARGVRRKKSGTGRGSVLCGREGDKQWSHLVIQCYS